MTEVCCNGNMSTRLVVISVTAALVATSVAVGAGLASGSDDAEETVFVPITPCRLLDTRPGDINVGPRAEKIGEDEAVAFTAWGTGDADSPCNVPITATAIATNAVAIQPTARSFMTLYPGDVDNPGTANLNYVAGQAPTPNAANIPLSSTGTFNIFNAFGDVHAVIDVNGYYQPSSAVGGSGPAGADGANGADGQDGTNGAAGADGDDGADGTNGGVKREGRLTSASNWLEPSDVVASSIVVNAFGQPVISYSDSAGTVNVIVCIDPLCQTASFEELDDDAGGSGENAVAILSSGIPVIAYAEQNDDELRLAICDDSQCDLGSDDSAIDGTVSNPAGVSIAIDANDGLAVAYRGSAPSGVKIFRCLDIECATFGTETLDAAAGGIGGTSITIGTDGFPVVAYHDDVAGTLEVATCTTASCASFTVETVATGLTVDSTPSIAIGPSGSPVIAYASSSSDVDLTTCTTTTCSTSTTSTILSGSTGIANSVMTLDSSGNPLVLATIDNGADELRTLAWCADAACAEMATIVLDDDDDVLTDHDLTLDALGKPLAVFGAGNSVVPSKPLTIATSTWTASSTNSWDS